MVLKGKKLTFPKTPPLKFSVLIHTTNEYSTTFHSQPNLSPHFKEAL